VPSDVDQIVAEVVRRLEAAAGSTASRSWEGEAPAEPRSARTDSGVLIRDDRVLSVTALDGQLDGLRRLIVHRKAIVTPALQEELSRRGIALDRGGENAAKRSSVAVSVVRLDAEQAPSLHTLGLAEDVTVASIVELVRTVEKQLEDKSRLVVVLTRQTTVALCALNRNANVRAALATNVESVRAAARAIAANVLVVDPSHLGRVQAAAIVRALEAEGVRSVPMELKAVL